MVFYDVLVISGAQVIFTIWAGLGDWSRKANPRCFCQAVLFVFSFEVFSFIVHFEQFFFF